MSCAMSIVTPPTWSIGLSEARGQAIPLLLNESMETCRRANQAGLDRHASVEALTGYVEVRYLADDLQHYKPVRWRCCQSSGIWPSTQASIGDANLRSLAAWDQPT